MEDLFRSYWWLVFPLGWFVAMGFSSWMNYRRQRDTLDLLRTYAEKGQEPPAELLRAITRREEAEAEMWGVGESKHSSDRPWPWQSMVVMFAVLCAGFTWAHFTDLYGAGEAFAIVAFTMGAVCLAFLVSGIFGRRPKA